MKEARRACFVEIIKNRQCVLDFFGKLDEKGDDWLPVPFHDLTDSSTDF